MDSLAVVATYVFGGESRQYRLLELGYIPAPTRGPVQTFTLASWGGGS